MTTSNTPYAELVKQLDDGTVQRQRRWSGDTHTDLGGSIDEEATDALMEGAARAIELLEAERDRFKALYLAAFDEADRRNATTAPSPVGFSDEEVAKVIYEAFPDEGFNTVSKAWVPIKWESASAEERDACLVRARAVLTHLSAQRKERDDGVTAPATGRSPISQEGSIAPEALSEEAVAVVPISLMKRVWANLYFNKAEAGNTYQWTLDSVVDWLAKQGHTPWPPELCAQRSPSDERNDVSEDGRIIETITFKFDDAEQQRRFHERLEAPVQTGAVGSVPGWKLVPVEPTEEMCRAGAKANDDADQEDRIWADMLATSPSPPQAVTDVGGGETDSNPIPSVDDGRG